jgi:Secretion system C-terminal sorting domain
VNLRLDDNWVGHTQVQVHDLSGKLLAEMALNPTDSREAQLNLQGLSAGVYMVACVTDGQRVVRKLMLQ